MELVNAAWVLMGLVLGWLGVGFLGFVTAFFVVASFITLQHGEPLGFLALLLLGVVMFFVTCLAAAWMLA